MCGIIGKIFSHSPAQPLQGQDLDRLQHRGPDDQGIYNDSHASLGHCRLSIIDLSSAGHQPMPSPDGRYAIVYNGEVYNYLEVRELLLSEGIVFKTQTDTEVVLNAYLHWGADCLHHFRGMFAFAIWDKDEQKLFMARDRCGEKPFIYYMDKNNFFFSSEFKALIPMLPEMPELNPAVVDMYLNYQYAPEPFTLLKNVHKLPAAHYALLDVKTWSFEFKEYWDLLSIKADSSLTKQDIKNELNKAIQLTLRADVPVGIALSAGIDSAGIAAIASKHYSDPMKAFCVGYPGRPAYDERSEAETIAKYLGCEFNEVELATDQFVTNFPAFAMMMDEPIADIAAFGHYAVPKFCADSGIKVLLTGIGGDELFWGYDWTRAAVSVNQHSGLFKFLSVLIRPLTSLEFNYKFLHALSRAGKVPRPLRDFFRKLLAAVDNDAPSDQFVFMAATGAPEFSRHTSKDRSWHGPAMKAISNDNIYVPTRLVKSISKADIPVHVMNLLFKTWLVGNCLSLGDRVSMAAGVETRLPLLDYKLIEKVIAWRRAYPDHTKGQKSVLREILSDLLPQKTIQRRKSGFVPPVMQWIKGITQQYGASLKSGHLAAQGIIKNDINITFGDTGSLPPYTFYRLVLLEKWYSGLTELYNRDTKVLAA